MKNNDDPVTVFTTSKAAEAEIVRNMLEAEGIRCQIANELQAGFGGVMQIPVLVRAEDEDAARALLGSRVRLEEDEPIG